MAAVDTSRFKTSSGRQYIDVIWGDTLSEILQAYKRWPSATKPNITMEEVASINDIKDVDVILVGERIYFAASTSAYKPPVKTTHTPEVPRFGLLTGFDRRLYAAWTCVNSSQTAKFDVEWRCYRSGLWMNEYRVDKEVDVDRQNDTFDIPDDDYITKVQFRVCPVPNKKTNSEGKDTEEYEFAPNEYWTSWDKCTYYVVNKPDVPSNFDASIIDLPDNKIGLLARVTNLDPSKVSILEFQLVKDGSVNASQKVPVNGLIDVSPTFTVEAGSIYKVRCRSIKNDIEGEWTNYSHELETRPAKVAFTEDSPRATSETSVYVEWSAAAKANATGAITYTLAYTDNTEDPPFYEGDNGKGWEVTTTKTHYTVNDTEHLKNGGTYSFRVKAKNSNNQESEWSEIKTVTIGSSPTVPTTWSSTTTAIAGPDESVLLYWTHNSTDGSAQKNAIVTLEFKGEGVTKEKVELLKENVRVDEDRASIKEIKVLDVSEDGLPRVEYHIESKSSDTSNNAMTYALIIDTEDYVDVDGASITWTVSTTGVTGEPSGSSIARTVTIYNKPYISLIVTDPVSVEIGTTYYKVDYYEESNKYLKTEDTLDMLEGTPMPGIFVANGSGEQVFTITIDDEVVYYCREENESLKSFPFNVKVRVDTNTLIQKPIEYHVSIAANESYETVDNFGRLKNVSAEELLYSKHFSADSSNPPSLEVPISAEDVSLVSGQSYTVKCVAAMSSGIIADATTEIHVSWSSEAYSPSAEIILNKDNCSVSIRPYCELLSTVYYKVNYSAGRYVTDTTVKYRYIYGSVQSYLTTVSGDQVYYGTTPDGVQTYYTIRTESDILNNLKFGVYRREYDGSFTEILSDIDAATNSFVTDPHPSLDYARYRITAKEKTTGAISYSDISNFHIGEKAIILQWNEPHIAYAVSEEEVTYSRPLETFLRLPYNIDVSDSRDPDVVLVKYIGRKHPVSYRGTQVGEKASWSTEVPKSDTETLYTLQRLQAWTGDVYVRNPYGIGYWANVRVTMTRTHRETVVPVTLDITRVEGGI